MSKPKPGLGKGLVRSALANASHVHGHSHSHSHGHPSLAATTSNLGALSLAPVTGHSHSHAYSSKPIAGSSSAASFSTFPASGAPPPSNVSIGGGYLSLLPSWDRDTGDIVATYRQSTLRIPNPLKYITSSASPIVGTYAPGAVAGPGPSSIRRYTTPSAPARDAASSFSTPPIPPGALFDISAFPKSSGYTFSEFFSSPPPPPPPPPGTESSAGRSPSLKPPRPSSSTQTVLSPLPVHSSSPSPISIIGYPYLAFPDLPPPAPPTAVPDTGSSLAHAYASDLVFRYGASGLAKERIALPPSSSPPRAPTPPPRPRSFAIPEVDPPREMRSVGIGEDAYFARGDSMCVADGVGGWAKSGRGGADAGRWSRLLTHFCEGEVGAWWAGEERYLEDADDGGGASAGVKSEERAAMGGWAGRLWKSTSGSTGLGIGGLGEERDDGADRAGLPEGKKRRRLDPVEIMQRGFEKCLGVVLAEGVHGSSTCLLALLHHNSLLVANLGDCCLLLIRRGEVVFRTSEMQHAFNFPLQLGTHSRDEPMKDAKRYTVGVEKDDVVVVGSDGLMDNLFDEDILDTLAEFSSPSADFTPALPTPPPSRPSSADGLPPFNPQKVSEVLCRKARSVSEQTTATTPFMVRAIEEGIDFVGGKKDDISVLVGVIGERRADDGRGLTLHTHTR